MAVLTNALGGTMIRRTHTKEDALRTLRRKGLNIGTILDVGVQFDTPELRTQFADVHQVLFEPITEYHETIRQNYAGLSYEIVESAVSDIEGEMHFHSIRSDEDTGYVSHVRPAEKEWPATRSSPCVTLDGFLATRILPGPYLLKIDVDGHETAILEGGIKTLRDSACLIVETTMPHLPDRCALAKAAGMCLWDIVDFAYYEDNLYQVDLIFLPYSLIMTNDELDPYASISRRLDASQWYEHPG
jgi:FkbM family methyltransferase